MSVPERTRTRMVAVGMVMAILIIPVYWIRNDRWVWPAKLSAHVFREIRQAASTIPTGLAVVLLDEPQAPTTLVSVFSTLVTEGVQVAAGKELQGWLEPSPALWELVGLRPPVEGAPTTTFALRNGRLVALGTRR